MNQPPLLEFDAARSGKRVLFYSPDSFGLGHFRRSLTIAEAIAAAAPKTQMLCITGSPRPDMFELPNGFDTIKLPSITKDLSGEYQSLARGFGLDELKDLRTSLVRTVVDRFQPDVLLVDHSPFGTLGELVPVLDEMKKHERCVTVYGMRDIIDSKERLYREWEKSGVTADLGRLFDQVLVYADPEVFDSRVEYDLERLVPKRSHVTGIVCRCPPCAAFPPRVASTSSVLVTTGGGKDGLHISEAALRALPDHFDRVRVILGPLADVRTSERLEGLRAPDRVEIVRESHQMCEEYCHFDLVVGMAGYNTAYEVIRARKRYVAVPRNGPRQEQPMRARRLAQLGLAAYVDSTPRDLDARLLAACLEAETPDSRHLPDFGGAQRSAQLLLQWAGVTSSDLALAAERHR